MTERADTIARIVLLAIAAGTIVAMYAVGGNESLTRGERFVWLSLLGLTALVGWPGTSVAQRYESRRPLRIAWGKPAQPSGVAISARQTAAQSELPARYALDIRNTLVAGGVSLIVAAGSGAIGYALAGSATSSDGGFIVYMVFAGSAMILVRSMFRVANAARAVELAPAELTLGRAIGYVPPLRLDMADIVAIEWDEQQRVALVTSAERRFELDAGHLATDGFPAALAATWPGVAWRAWPAPAGEPS